MVQKGFYFDSSRCSGCKTCEMACKDYKGLDASVRFRKVYDIEGGDWSQDESGVWTTGSFVYHVAATCNHCDNPACLNVCPTGAVVKDEETGLEGNDTDTCIGCGSCVTACPYDEPTLVEDQGVARRCDGCLTRVIEGKAPICVEACPMRALEFDDIEALRSKYGDKAEISPLPSASETMPNLVIGLPPNMTIETMATGIIVNEMEVV